jgi:citrate lyase subunit beta/citryl-CoA lyase
MPRRLVLEILRSLIFVPGNRRDMLEKARDFDADAIVADLEDSVPPAEKENARGVVRDMAPTLSGRGQKVLVRLNSLDTGLTRDELAALIGPHLYGISIGKVESTWDIKECDRIASALEKGAGLEPGHLKIVPWIENSRAVMRVYDIAIASPRVVGLAFGAEDYTDDMDIQRTDEGDEVYFPRATVALAARAAGVAALDSPFVRFRDQDGLKREIEVALKLGFKGKFAIHPAQLDTINTMFSPRPEDVEYARRVMEAWDQAEAEGRGSTSLDGRMIDVPVVKRARSLLAMADAIAERK